MSEEDKTRTSKVDQVFKGIHHRVSSFGKYTKPTKAPTATLAAIADEAFSSHSSSPFSSLKSHPQRRNDERDTRLLSLDKLINGTAVTEKHRLWFEKLNIAVRTLMNSSDYDPSHDYEHIQRVVLNAHHIWGAEKHREEFCNIDPLVIFVAAMVHDVADDKYLVDELELQKEVTDRDKQERQRDAIEAFIKKAAPECPAYIRGPATHVAALVSFTRELRRPELIAQQCMAYPALQIVQDADRLDGLGALGIVRGTVYGGANQPRGTGTVRRVCHVVDERHSQYVAMMKTRTGKKEASKRWNTMEEIRDQIVAEADCRSVLEGN
ncbi:hypothetical protein J4E91_007135 [Alternaria rosae]|nr:hypothetical protein J4E91_007135 [Alternaria rosae]